MYFEMKNVNLGISHELSWTYFIKGIVLIILLLVYTIYKYIYGILINLNSSIFKSCYNILIIIVFMQRNFKSIDNFSW